MGKRCAEEFNPWPPFVDIFSSTILVLLLFMLILIVNLGYYAQFKSKVHYTGTVATDQLILDDDPRINKVEEKEVKVESTTIIPIVKTSMIAEIQEQKEFERAGQDLVQVDDTNTTLQDTIRTQEYMVVNFADKEILLDDPTIREVKQFIEESRGKFPKHKVIVSSVEPTNQISSTVAKQISLARTLNTRNLIRKQGYKNSDVRVRLINEQLLEKIPPKEAGFVVISIEVSN